MKERYENLTDFISDILEAAESASKTIVDDIKNKDSESTVKNACSDEIKYKKFDNQKVYNGSSHNNNLGKNSYETPSMALKPLPANITIDNNNHYILNEMVNGWPTLVEHDIIFEHITENGYKVPGITENQILAVLYDRYKNNPKKLDLVRQLMN